MRITGSAIAFAVVVLSCGGSEDGGSPDLGDGSGTAGGLGGSVAASDSGTSTGVGGTQAQGGAPGTGGAHASGGSTGTGGTPGLPAGAPNLTPGEWTVLDPSPVDATCGSGTYCVALHPTDPAVIYQCFCACNYQCGVYKTTDAGSSWRQVGALAGQPGRHLESTNHLRIDPKNPNRMYGSDGVHGGTNGFWVSTDAGETFSVPQGFADKANNSVGGWTTDVYDVAADPTDFNHVLVSFHSPFEWSGSSGVLESKDGGNTWIRHYPVSTLTGAGWGIWFLYRPDLGIGDSGTWLLGAQGGGHFRTTDAGASWTKVADNSMEHGGGQIYYSADAALYSTGMPNIMTSTDNGASWQMVGPSAGYIGITGDGSHMYAKAHDRSNPIITAPESDGTSWSNYAPQPPTFNGGCYEYAFDAKNGIVYGACVPVGLLAMKVR